MGMVTGYVSNTTITNNVISNAMIVDNAGIEDSKLAVISSAGKVANM